MKTAKTKFELVQINARLATENSDLRARVSQLQMDLEIAKSGAPKPKEEMPSLLREQVCLFMDLADPITTRRTA